MVLHNERERIIEKLYPDDLMCVKFQRNSQYHPCDFSRIPHHFNPVEVELKSFRKGVFEDSYPYINTITCNERSYIEEILCNNKYVPVYCFVVLYFHENNTCYITRVTDINMLKFSPWNERYAICKDFFRQVNLSADFRLFL